MEESILLTDVYQLTMLQTHFDRDMNGKAVFEFFDRKLPEGRNFLFGAGRRLSGEPPFTAGRTGLTGQLRPTR